VLLGLTRCCASVGVVLAYYIWLVARLQICQLTLGRHMVYSLIAQQHITYPPGAAGSWLCHEVMPGSAWIMRAYLQPGGYGCLCAVLHMQEILTAASVHTLALRLLLAWVHALGRGLFLRYSLNMHIVHLGCLR
jgi:hypothetical protein